MKKIIIFLILIMFLISGCGLFDSDDDGSDDEEDEYAAFCLTIDCDPIDLDSVVWLHTNIKEWPITSQLKSVTTSGSTITLDHTKASEWPGIMQGDKELHGNPWVFVNQGGTWYAATWEWLRTGQTTKSLRALRGDHIKSSPLLDWYPKVGETYGFMVSGLARSSTRNVEERTNVLMVPWTTPVDPTVEEEPSITVSQIDDSSPETSIAQITINETSTNETDINETSNNETETNETSVNETI